MTIASETTRSSGAIAERLEVLNAEIAQRDGEERIRRRKKLELLEEAFANLLVARDRGERVDADQITKAQQAIDAAKLDVDANDHTIRALTTQRESVRRDQQQAQAQEALAEGDRIRDALSQARVDLLEALVEASRRRGIEYGLEAALHRNGMDRDRLADKFDYPGLRRGIVVFDGAIRPHVDRLGGELQKLCNELGVTIDEHGRVVPREKRPATVPTPSPAADNTLETESALDALDSDHADDEVDE
ncbi:MAG: hypothetical protein AABM40_05810 [Chloroflexota bacterium]